MTRSRFSIKQVLDLKAHQKMKAMMELINLKKEKKAIERKLDALTSHLKDENVALDEEMDQLVYDEIRLRVIYLDHIRQQLRTEVAKLSHLYKKMATTKQRCLQYIQEVQVLKLFESKSQLQNNDKFYMRLNPLKDNDMIQKTLNDYQKTTFYKKNVL